MDQDERAKKAFEQIIDSVMVDLESRIRETLKPVFMAGVELGRDQTQEAIAEALLATMPTLARSATARTISKITVSVGVPHKRSNGGYSGVAEAVRTTLRTIGAKPTGASIESIKGFIGDKVGRPDITAQQIRSSLKALMDSGEAIRVDRGAYRAGPKLHSGLLNGTSPFQPAAIQ
jgi:hypothetical protein